MQTTSAPQANSAPSADQDTSPANLLRPSDTFVHRHVGPNADEIKAMLAFIECDSLDDLVEQTVPAAIRIKRPLKLGEPRGEHELIAELKKTAARNKVMRSCLGMGYYGTITPPVIQRNILENPGWYTQYTPYQAEISQGRLEALINFQTMVADLTGLPLSNASMLDEATAAAEAMFMARSVHEGNRQTFLVAADCHPQTIAVLRTRARFIGMKLVVVATSAMEQLFTGSGPGGGLQSAPETSVNDISGILLQYPTTDGRIECYKSLTEAAHKAGAIVVAATDLLALTLITPPGEWGADIAVGNTQRFGVPMGFGGPHAGFMATKTDYARKLPGRLIGVSKDAQGNPAYRLTLQTREQHIRRDRATSNICTAQVLLAIMAGMYATYHGPHGLTRIAQRVRAFTQTLRLALRNNGDEINDHDLVFDTLKVRPKTRSSREIIDAAQKKQINLRDFGDGTVGISLDETTDYALINDLLDVFGVTERVDLDELVGKAHLSIPPVFERNSAFLAHPVFNKYHSEHELLRYIFKLMGRDLSLCQSMIPLGSCTMKLNGTSEMLPVTWPEFGAMHPFAPDDQTKGYQILFKQLEKWLCEITGFAACSLQPNAGSQGEYAGLLAIKAYHESRGEIYRDICLIPTSAHGTNPASAVIAGFKVVAVACDDLGNVDLTDLKAKADANKTNLGALMVTYPSTHGVFEEGIKQICKIIHAAGGQVYMDGANMNAQVGLCRPGDIGADVCHLNLHKTFCIPHGGGGPGMGPICVAKQLIPFLPAADGGLRVVGRGLGRDSSTNPQLTTNNAQPIVVSAAPYGSPSILPISWVYIALMGSAGLTRATQVAILNANYMANRLKNHYPLVYSGTNGRVAHEFILDCRAFQQSAGVTVEDIAKRLMDYGFHAPTMSWPVSGTLMIEPTESEAKDELDRLCEALISVRQEIREIEEGKLDRADNPLKHAPHTAGVVTADNWSHKYSRERAAYPAKWLHDHKFWPHVGRVDNPYGDRNLMCTCAPMTEAQA